MEHSETDGPLTEDLRTAIREIPDFPKEGILFYDITTLLKDARCFQRTIDALAMPHIGQPLDYIVGIDARGFILGAAVAYKLCKGGSGRRRRPPAGAAPSPLGQSRRSHAGHYAVALATSISGKSGNQGTFRA